MARRRSLLAALTAAGAAAQAWTDPCSASGLTPVGAAEIDNSLWAGLLTRHVRTGQNVSVHGITSSLVDYAAIRQDPRPLRSYLQQFCGADVAALPARDAVANLINFYNALMVLMVVHFDPPSSVNEIPDRWSGQYGTLNGQKVSLDHVEHVMVRGQGGPSQSRAGRAGVAGRAHAGFVCASLSCPDLRPEPYEGARLASQLTEQTRSWLANPTKNPGPDGDRLVLSRLFSWYGADFALESGSVQAFVAGYSGFSPASGARLDFAPYNWNLNAVGVVGTWSSGGWRAHAPVWPVVPLSLAAALAAAVRSAPF